MALRCRKCPPSCSGGESPRLAYLGAPSSGGGSEQSQAHNTVKRGVKLDQALTLYLAEGSQINVEGFCLPGFGLRRSYPTLDQNPSVPIAPAGMPHLALIAPLYHEVGTLPVVRLLG